MDAERCNSAKEQIPRVRKDLLPHPTLISRLFLPIRPRSLSLALRGPQRLSKSRGAKCFRRANRFSPQALETCPALTHLISREYLQPGRDNQTSEILQR